MEKMEKIKSKRLRDAVKGHNNRKEKSMKLRKQGYVTVADAVADNHCERRAAMRERNQVALKAVRQNDEVQQMIYEQDMKSAAMLNRNARMYLTGKIDLWTLMMMEEKLYGHVQAA